MYKSKGRDGSGSNNNGSGPVEHRCKLCGLVFTSKNALDDHLRAAHQDFTLGRKRKRSSLPSRKRIRWHPSFFNYYPCRQCNEMFESYGDLERHGLACPPQSRESLDAHQPSVIQENSVPPSSSTNSSVQNKCPFCNREFATYRGLGNHMRRCSIHEPLPPSSSANSSEGFKCDFCNKEFASRRALGSHMSRCRRIHEPVPPSSSANSSVGFKCDFCNKEFASRRGLGIHMNRCRRRHEPVPPSSSANSSVQNKCNFCNTVFSTAQALGNHEVSCRHICQLAQSSVVNRYEPIPPPSTNSSVHYRCGFCNTVFSTSQALGNHEVSCRHIYQLAQSSVVNRYDTVPPPSTNSFVQHRCDFCNTVFSTSQALRNHEMSSRCIFQLAQPSAVNRYDPVPTSSSPNLSVQHRCNFCNTVFSTAQALGNHEVSCRHIYQLAQSSVVNRYEPVPPPSTNSSVHYRCSFCNTVFSTAQAVRNHEVLGICIYQPAQPSAVNRYDPVPPSSSANLSVQHRCSFCNTVFSTAQAVRNHQVSGICLYNLAQPSAVNRNRYDPVPPSPSANLSVQHRCNFCNTVFSTAQALGNHQVSCRHIYQLAQSSVLPQPSQAAPSTLPPSSAYSSGEGQATGGSQQEAQVKTQLHLNRTQPSP